MITEEQAKQDIRELLEYIGDDPNRVGLQATPDRMLRMFKEMFRGYNPEEMPVITTFPNGQDGIIYDNMVIDNGSFYSVCEHHCRTFFGEYWIAYIPNKKGESATGHGSYDERPPHVQRKSWRPKRRLYDLHLPHRGVQVGPPRTKRVHVVH